MEEGWYLAILKDLKQVFFCFKAFGCGKFEASSMIPGSSIGAWPIKRTGGDGCAWLLRLRWIS